MFRFTIRDVLWLMVVVGMGVGWWLHVQGIKQAEERRAQKLLLQAQAMAERVQAELELIEQKSIMPNER